MSAEPEVRAAGGVVVRERDGRQELVAVHRPKYDDWSLPKGKLHAGEDWEAAALREVAEETGLHCELGEELESTSYRDQKGRQKLVRYWLMKPLEGDFVSTDEIDAIRWLTPAEAAATLSHEHDRRLALAAASRS